MKKIFILLFSLNLTFFLCQKVELKKVTDSSQIFKGNIAGVSITMQLDYTGIVDCNQYQHFVEGWYYYDKYQKKIPLTGVYDEGDLFLYHFGNKQKQQTKALKEKITSPRSVEKTDSIARKLNPTEILNFKRNDSHKDISGNLFLGKTTHEATLYTKNSMIYRYNNYLILPNHKKINTFDIINRAGGNSLISTASDESGNRVLLYFEQVSNFNYCGMCGASDGEKGYRVLYFTKDWNYKSYDQFLTESCREGIYDGVVTKSKDAKILKFAIKKTSTSPGYTFSVDLSKASVKKSK
ncbi:hypothetical protein [Chryseobacterium pennipullorum]|uniref:Uncharacterized protein n=1 Tax=Chryseobacterium pennipullorum TaxID=2258963 RepID=A0A3D9B5N7_9FLAO|nr:hypothetical protein [Chryseobacterium pennipullorum]REC48863.1 hypothetical protein DRF67_04715 [Chryseobacterium pennipullorum]